MRRALWNCGIALASATFWGPRKEFDGGNVSVGLLSVWGALFAGTHELTGDGR